ncbi:MAG: DUF4331 domain-containing protein, partial [Pseudoxanthomonas sp.]
TSTVAMASSHREAPLITETPKVDGTDFYMFRSYEAGREGYVTFIANYVPLQDPYGGPNYFALDPDAVYAINIDNNGDAVADLSFEFRAKNAIQNLTVPVNGVDVQVPLSNIGQFGTTPSAGDAGKNVIESFTVTLVREGKQIPGIGSVDGRNLRKPFDNIGQKSIPNYAAYADSHIQNVRFRTCATDARVFVGQRKEGFAVALGKVFDLVNLNPLAAPDSNPNELADKNVTSLAIEIPIACLTTGGSPIIGAWTTASKPGTGNQMKQLSRLGAPLVNEVVIGLGDKDKFNASAPKDDGQFVTYVTNPTLPELIEILFPGVQAPNLFPRTDLVAAFLTGLDGLNKPANVVPSEMLRLNTSIAPKVASAQANLGALAGDTAGFPNGRRPGDDVVDIELRVAMGVLLPVADAPSGQFPYTDGATVKATDFRNNFPYLNTPIPGATF